MDNEQNTQQNKAAGFATAGTDNMPAGASNMSAVGDNTATGGGGRVTDPRGVHIAEFVYDLPDKLIARHPLEQRDACRLLVGDSRGVQSHNIFTDLPALLPSNAILVYNNTRVVNARLHFRKDSGALIEIFCLEPESPADYERNFASTGSVTWKCLVGNSKRWKQGELQRTLDIDGRQITLSVVRTVQGVDASWTVRFTWDDDTVPFARIIDAAGVIPIPPYLNRETEDSDSCDYQTVYSRIDGSVAAPTAGLHFTPRVLADIDARGIERREVTLHVGAGTFRPVKSEEIGDHSMHSEYIVVDKKLIEELAQTDRPVFAVGTTSVRTMESLYHIGCLMYQGKWTGEVPQWYPYDPQHPQLTTQQALSTVARVLSEAGTDKLVAATRIIIAPGYKYRIVKGMVTNFHQPGSTLLLLVSAMIGDAWRDIYAEAVKREYRFLSYGDACLFRP